MTIYGHIPIVPEPDAADPSSDGTPPGNGERQGLSNRREIRWLLAILAIGLLVRATTVIVLDVQPESDYAAYQSMALNLIAHQRIVDFMGNRAMYSVGYPLFVLAPVFWLFGNSPQAAQLANTFLGGVGIVLCYAIAREMGAGRSGRLLAAGLYALYLPSWVYAAYLAKENLMTPLMLGSIWCALRMVTKNSLTVAAGCGVLFGLLALTGNAALSLVPAAFAALALASVSIGRKLLASAIIVGAAMSIAAPWMIRNYHVLGAPVLTTNGGFNLYLGNNPAATGYFVSFSETPRGSTGGVSPTDGEWQVSETLRRDAVTWITEHPSQFLALALKKVALFWMPPIHEGKRVVSTLEPLIRWLWLVQFAVLVMGAVGSVLLSSVRTRYVGVLWLAIISYTAVHALFYVIFRYREPIMPFLCVLAALTLEDVSVGSRRRKRYAERFFDDPAQHIRCGSTPTNGLAPPSNLVMHSRSS